MLIKGSFEDYLYIIIGLIWVAFSIYKGARKKKQVADDSQSEGGEEVQEKKKSIFDDFLNEIIKGDETVPYEEVEFKDEIEKPVFVETHEPEKVFSYDDIVEESNHIDDAGVYEIKPVSEPTIKQDLKTQLKSKNQRRGFDLRKAVIYSEILNRRYF